MKYISTGEKRPIPGYNGKFWASDRGKIFSSRGQGYFHDIKQYNSNGYRMVSLWRDGKTFSVSVHRLVMLAFVGQPPENTEVMHLNSIRNDNRIENLRYGSHSCNMAFVPEARLARKEKALLARTRMREAYTKKSINYKIRASWPRITDEQYEQYKIDEPMTGLLEVHAKVLDFLLRKRLLAKFYKEVKNDE